MIGIAARLAVAGGRESFARLVVMVVGVAVGTAILLLGVSIPSAISARGMRGAQQAEPPAVMSEDPEGTDSEHSLDPDSAQTLVARTNGWFRDRAVTILNVAATGPDAPVPPGLERLPGPGEAVVSSALAELLAGPDGRQLRPRFPDRVTTGPVGDEALVHPDQLVAWVGWDPDVLIDRVSANVLGVVDAYPLPPPSNDWWTSKLAVYVGVVLLGIALLLPVLVFVGILARLSAAQRERRLAVLRLVGATPRQARMVAGMEAVLTAAVGSVVGFGLFLLWRPLAANVRIDGMPWFPTDFFPGWLALVVVLLGVPLTAGGAAVFTLRRVIASPEHIEAPEPLRSRPPVLPAALLVLGLVGLGITFWYGNEFSSGLWVAVAAVSLVALLIALPSLAPWLVGMLGNLTARWTPQAAMLLAARRTAADPRGAFRASSGVMLAMFVATIVFGYATGNMGHPRGGGWGAGPT